MLIHYYRSLEDEDKNIVTVEKVICVNGISNQYKQCIVFTRPSGEEVSIGFAMFISVTPNQSREVFVLTEVTDQNDFTEGHTYSSADPATEVLGVYVNEKDALAEKARLDAISAKDQEECDCDPTYYEVKRFPLK